MARRPPQGRGSGGRVTPRTRAPGAPARRAANPSAGRTGQPAGPPGRGAAPSATAVAPSGDDRTAASAGSVPAASAPPGASRIGLRQLLWTGPGPYVPPAERVRPWWGFGDVVLWYLVARFVSTLFGPPLAAQLGYPVTRIGPGSTMGEVMGRVAAGQSPAVTAAFVDMPLWLRQGVFQLPLWACLVGGSVYATTRKGFGPVRDLKLRMRPVDVPLGIAVGLAAQFLLNPLLYGILAVFVGDVDPSAAARSLTSRATSPAAVVFLVVTVGFVAPFAEELFFRGLALRSLHRRFGVVWAVVLSAALFALVHGSPLLLVGLFPLGIILAVLVERFDRLGPALTTHITYNLATATVLVAGIDLPW